MLGTGAGHEFERHVLLSATNDATRRVTELSQTLCLVINPIGRSLLDWLVPVIYSLCCLW